MPFGKGGIGSAKAVWEFAWSGGLRFRRRPDLEIRSAGLWGDRVACQGNGIDIRYQRKVARRLTEDGTDSFIQRVLSACSLPFAIPSAATGGFRSEYSALEWNQ